MTIITRIKVIHLTSVHPPFDTRIFHKECRSLAQTGYEVVLVAATDRGAFKDGVRLRKIRPAAGRMERMTRVAWNVIHAGIAEQGDVYHFHDSELLPWAQYLRWRTGKNVVYDMHENVRGAILTKPWIPQPLRIPFSLFFQLIERLLLSGLHIIYAEHSYAIAYPWVKHATTVLNLPDTIQLSKIHKEKFPDFTVGYIGGVSTIRGSEIILEALCQLHRAKHSTGFACVGPATPTHQALLEDKVVEWSLPGITFYGQLPQEKGWRIMARCHSGLAILKKVPNYVGSYPTKMFEYMALGLPVIVSDFPIYREIVEKRQCVFA